MARVEADGRFRDSCELAARLLARDSEALAVGLHVQNILLAARAGVEVALELDHDVEVRAAPRAARQGDGGRDGTARRLGVPRDRRGRRLAGSCAESTMA